jgi:hypothetical protein
MNINKFCEDNKIDLIISYNTDPLFDRVMVETLVTHRFTRETILYRYDRYPQSDEELMLEIIQSLREWKLKRLGI